MNKNDIFETEITGITDNGSGVGRAEGIAVFVPYALPGEIVRVIIVKVNKNYAFGKLDAIIKPSPYRIKSECPYFYRCGGCQFQNVDYAEELRIKRRIVQDCINRIGGLNIDVPEVIGAERCSGYRNKGQFPVGTDGIGIYAQHSHRIVDMESCAIQNAETPQVIRCVREWMTECGIPPYNEIDGSGVVRHIYTRCGGGNITVCIVTKGSELPHSEVLISKLTERIPNISGILHNINNAKTNVVLGPRLCTLWGEEKLIDSIGSKSFKLSPLSFYQVNNAQTKVLYDIAMKFADLRGDEIVWDLYCGIGTIGQYAADGAARIIGVEIVPEAVENAVENARLNNLTNTEYYCGAAENIAPTLLGKKLSPDVIILDPPRKGCDEALIETAVKAAPKRIVYISCKPSTLARDLKIFGEKGYRTVKIRPVDMFPRTSHVETVVLLQKHNM